MKQISNRSRKEKANFPSFLIQNCLINRSINKSILDYTHHVMHLSYILYNHIHFQLFISSFITDYICICDLRLNLSLHKTKKFSDKFPIDPLSDL